MAKKPRYSLVSPLATAFGLAVTGAASSNPITAPSAATRGTVAAGILGGANLTDEEMTVMVVDYMQRTKSIKVTGSFLETFFIIAQKKSPAHFEQGP